MVDLVYSEGMPARLRLAMCFVEINASNKQACDHCFAINDNLIELRSCLWHTQQGNLASLPAEDFKLDF